MKEKHTIFMSFSGLVVDYTRYHHVQGVHKKIGLQNPDNPDIILTFLAKNPDIFFLYRPRLNILAETTYLFSLRTRQVC